MIRFFKERAAALRVVFLASVLVYLAQYAASHWHRSELGDLVGALLFFSSLPWSWLAVLVLEPVLPLLPAYLGDAFMNAAFAAGFALNATGVVALAWAGARRWAASRIA